ncbi:hypothetical protein KDW99_08820 [Marinomonas rhizomae]|uniref:hypothetical protein n=1 Tax=Marinomonas rhizomae TaxID=491948 RepID=UPI00210297F0|nr:hypothetical protein [Marinomonas rhizomae]UTW01210.1 hypothetical protein KDW99_08820 [Marinomonas rhizomae]
MSFKDVEWWVCCAFIITISYTLGTLTGFPAWPANTDKLSVAFDLATIIASVATFFAAIYAYKSFATGPTRQRQQHKLERSSESLKELSRAYEQTMLELFRFCKQTVSTQAAKGFAKSGGHFIGKYLKQYEELIEVQNRFMDNLSPYKSAYTNHKCILGEDTIDVYSDKEILTFYEDLTKEKRQFNDDDAQRITEFHNKGTAKIEALFKELYATT